MRYRMARDPLIHNADLSALSTFRLPARADQLLSLSSLEDLEHSALLDPNLVILGGGSNTVFLSDWPGLVVINQLKGLSVRDEGDEVVISVGAGESWHGLVRHCLDQGWYGIENLILIPGSVGGAPIQNIGAYGVEISSVIEQVICWDRVTRALKPFSPEACQFAYRDSVFKHMPDHRYLITQVDLRLSKTFTPQANYPSLKQALAQQSSRQVTAGDVTADDLEATASARVLAATIMRLRRHRLPDPNRIANVGSFFKNPIVTFEQAKTLAATFPQLPQWPVSDPSRGQGVKLSAAWMIEHLGFKGKQIGDAAVYTHHALVLINQGHASADDLEALISEITESVSNAFGVSLVPEPQLIKAPA